MSLNREISVFTSAPVSVPFMSRSFFSIWYLGSEGAGQVNAINALQVLKVNTHTQQVCRAGPPQFLFMADEGVFLRPRGAVGLHEPAFGTGYTALVLLI